MPGIHFDITADNSNFVQKVQQVNNSVKSASITLETLSLGTASFSEKIVGLNESIEATQSVINRNTKDLERMGQAMSKALEAGDTAEINAISAKMNEMAANTEELTSDLNNLKNALSVVEQMSGLGASTMPQVTSPQYYANKSDYDTANALRAQAESLKSQIADNTTDRTDEQLNKLRESLSATEAELRKVEASAADAAARLGADLGTRAAEASENLYKLDDAIKQQQGVVNSLSEAVTKAAKELKDLKDKNADASEIATAQTAYDGLATSLNNAQNEMRNLQVAQQEAQQSMRATQADIDRMNAEIKEYGSVMVRMLGGYEKYTQIISNLPAPIQSTIRGMQGMTGAAKAFIATPLGAVIAAIILALTTLKSWFDSTVEGQLKFAEISGYVSGVLGQLKEIVIKVGETIYKAFTNPKKAISDLWEAIKTNLVNRIKAVGGIFTEFGAMVSEAFSGNWSEAKSHFGELKDQVLQLTTGVENLTDKVSDYAGGIHDAAKATAEIARANKDLEIEEHEWGKRNAALQKIKAEAQAKMYDTSIPAAERKKAMKEFEGALQEQYDKEREFADRRIALQERTMSLTSNTIEDENKLRDLQAARANLDAKQSQEMASLQRRKNSINNSERSAENAAQKQVEIQQKLNADLQKLRDENQSNEVSQMKDGSEKVLAIIETNYQKRKSAIEKQIAEFAKLNKKAGIADVNENGLTAEQQTEINKSFELNEAERKRSTTEINRAELTAMRDYLKEYGTYQQQKLAIAEEYAEKISKAQTEGERLALQKQQEAALGQVTANIINQQIDWQAVFGGFTGVLEEQLRETLSGLKDYIKTDKFKAASAEDKKLIYEAINKIQQQLPGNNKGTLNFGRIKQQMDALGTAINNAQSAARAEAVAQQNLADSQRAYEAALKSGNKAQIDMDKSNYELAQKVAAESVNTLNLANAEVQNLGNSLSESSRTTVDGLNLVADGLQGFAGGTLPGAFAGLQDTLSGLSKLDLGDKLNKSIGKLSETLSNAGFIGQIIAAILSVLDILKEGIGTLIASLIDSILGAINGILSNILSGDLFVQIFSSIKDGIGNILNTITYGGFNSWISSSNAKDVEKTIDRLTERNELLTKSINALKDSMDRARGMQTVEAYKQASEYQREQNENYKAIAQAQAGYHGAHHSWQSYWGGFTDEQIERLSKQIGRAWGGDIWDLSPEEMQILQGNIDMWEAIINTGKGGYGERLGEKLEDYIAQAGKINELTDDLKEKLTGMTFDSMYDNFIDKLMDMDASAEDIADKVAEYFMRAMLNNKVGELYEKELQEWYDDFAAAVSDEEGLTQDEINKLNARYNDIVNRAVQERNELAAITGYDKVASKTEEQKATAGGYETISEDTGQELNGRFTAVQDSNERIAQSILLQIESLRQIADISTESNETLKSMLFQIVMINDYLEIIAAYNKKIAGFGEKLDRIATNTQ